MVRELKNRRLITIRRQDGQDVISIHRLLQQKILEDLDKDVQRREHVFSQVFELVRKRFPEASPIQEPQPEKWPQCMKVLPHVSSLRIVVAKAVPRIAPTLNIARLFADGGTHLWERGKVIEALRLMRTSEAVFKSQSNDDKQLRANIHIIIALLVQHFGISHRAEVLGRVEKAVQRREELQRDCPQGEYTRNHAILLNNALAEYGCALLQYNKHKEAEAMFNRCLVKYQEWGTQNEFPFEYAKYYHHIAFCKMYQGKFDEAIASMEKSIQLTTQAIGDNVHLSYGDLACIVLQSGDVQRSLDIQQRLLSSRLELHGKSGLLTMQTYYAIGALHSYLGNLEEAE
jgi:tetratricopeptide (TPR) repeat protein